MTNLAHRFLAAGCVVGLIFGSAQADDVAPTERNALLPAADTTPANAAQPATGGQFGGFAPVSSSATTGANTTKPASGGAQLQFSYFGTTFAGAPPEFSIGDTIGLPIVSFTDSLNRVVGLRREPVHMTDAPFLYVTTPGGTNIQTFNPATTILSERFFWSPHAAFQVVPDASGAFERTTIPGEAGTSQDGFSYADQAGGAVIYWRTLAPVAKDGANNPVYGLVQRAVSVASSTSYPVRKIFWTENGFQGPTVPVVKGDIQQVRVAYTDNFPALVADGHQYVIPGSVNTGTQTLPRFTLYYDTLTNALRAYNITGRVMVELLGEVRTGGAGLRRQIGIEVVDVIQEATPALVKVPLGERLYPLAPEQVAKQVYPLPSDTVQQAGALAYANAQLALYSPSLVLDAANGNANFTGQFTVAGQVAYYAERTTTSASDVQVYWLESGLDNLQWPKFLDRYQQYWPDSLADYSVNVRPTDPTLSSGTLPIFDNLTNFSLIYQDDPASRQAKVNQGTGFEVDLDATGPENRSLLLFRSGNSFWFTRVQSVLDTYLNNPAANGRYSAYYIDSDPSATDHSGVTAYVGQRLVPPAGADSVAGYVDLTKGDAIDPTAYINPFTAGLASAETGAIIPVNAAARHVDGRPDKNQLGVWWFNKVSPPSSLAGQFAPQYWPSYFVRYKIAWPTNSKTIVLASNAGSLASGALSGDAQNGIIYYQNDPAKTGYNPNEEHAQMIAGVAYALRNDLNFNDTTSAPYVLVRYTDSTDKRPAMQTFQVLKEDGTYQFTYPAKAGTRIQPPLPLSIMPNPVVGGVSRNVEVTPANIDPPKSDLSGQGLGYYASFSYEDHNGDKWLYRGPHDPTQVTPSLGMKFYYATRDGFAYPNATTGLNEAPPVGTITPFLHDPTDTVGDAKTGTAITVNFIPYWPDQPPALSTYPHGPAAQPIVADEVPQLQTAETLVKAKNGLPSLQGATSAKILYQQSIGLWKSSINSVSATKSAKMHDPTRRKVFNLSAAGLSRLPSSISTSSNNGKVYFENLPPHLQQRVYLDPALGPGNPSLGGLVLEGRFVDEPVGESYLLPNILSDPDMAVLQGLVTANDQLRPAWLSALAQLNTTLQTFKSDPAKPGTYIPDTSKNLVFGPSQLVEVTDDNQAVNSYALTAVGGGTGYVTLILGNGYATTPSEPVQVEILQVNPTLYQGQVKPLTPANPLSEQITMQHTGDFAGAVQNFQFEWFYVPAKSGQAPDVTDRPGLTNNSWFMVNDAAGKAVNQPRVTLSGSQPLLALTDNYYIMHYRPVAGGDWSPFTEPALQEGWIKRVLAGINPFDQRVSDFYNNTVNTNVSLIQQAGTRWEGDVPLTLDAVQNAGLIQIYETVLRRGIGFTIDGTPATNYAPANEALLLATGYLNDLYMALGNEAYADAQNPTISLDVDPSRLLAQQSLPASLGTAIQNTATSRFAFEGQVSTVLDEELVLLRGRDDLLAPGTQTAPVYNRFFWNFTRGIDSGEVIYALNYNISDSTGDGKIDAADAAQQFPQGHGDAYGHYLTAMSNYYRLLSDTHFTWTPQVEAVNILNVPVTVDYKHERKLAAAAVSLGQTAVQVLDLERRKLPVGTDSGWTAFRDSSPVNANTQKKRSWGVDEWASRAGQGNFVHWAVTNALLPENDTAHEGLQKIDRQNVSELKQLAALGPQIQTTLDAANRHANALNLSDNSILFDLSPSQLTAGSTHFDQVLARAKAALANAATAYNQTTTQNALLRTVANQASDYNFTANTQETAFTNRLIDIFGQAYAGDIGPGQTYPQGYSGPDLLHYMFIDRPYIYSTSQLYGAAPNNNTFVLPIKQSSYSGLVRAFDGTSAYAQNLNQTFTGIAKSADPTVNISYTFDLNNGPYQVATSAMGSRASTGSVQTALAAVMNAREQLYSKLQSLNSASATYQSKLQVFQQDLDAQIAIRASSTAFAATKLTVTKALGANDLFQQIADKEVKSYEELAATVVTGLPRVNGIDNDLTSGARAAVLAAKFIANKAVDATQVTTKVASYLLNLGLDLAELAKNETATELNFQTATRANIAALQSAYSNVFATVQDLDAANKEVVNSLNNYHNALSDGLTVQTERETFRQRAASIIQGARERDVAFRAFRTESLEQFKTLFDQAARYTFLAAKAYDYETALLGTDSGRSFLSSIVATRSLGLVGANGEPQFGGSGSGDPGLSSYLAKLQADWGVVKGRLGINNPDQYGTLLSLRRELFNLPFRDDGTVESDVPWQDKLRSFMVTDLRTDSDVAAHCLPTSNPSGLAQPGLIIPFSGDIETGNNFFGNALAAGDSAFSSASYSTKIFSVGVDFEGYLGMNPYATGGTGIPPAPTQSAPNALSATPYVYLIPAGSDMLRTPPLNGAAVKQRQFLVLDHAMPLPYNIGQSGFGETTSWTSSTTLTEPFFLPRMHQPFRAVSDPTLFYGSIPDQFTNRRLVGRSVWNTKWKLVIPAQTLLADPNDGMNRFINSVRDIKLYLRTYSNAGN